MSCPVFLASHILGKRWSIAVLNEFRLSQFSGFNKFVKKTGITPRTLSKQLKELEKERLIQKEKEDYFLTKKGKELCKVIDKLKVWNVKWNNVPKECLEKECTGCKLLSEKKK